MQKSKFGRFVDNVFLMLLSTLILYLILKKYISSQFPCLILSTVLSFLILKVIVGFQTRKLKKLSIEKDELFSIEKLNFELRKLPIKKQKDMLTKALNNTQIINYDNGLIIEEKIYLALFLDKDIVQKEDIFKAYITCTELKNKHKELNEIVIICNQISTEINTLFSFLDEFTFTVFLPLETYALFKNNNALELVTINKKPQKTHKTPLIKRSFMKKQAKNFFKSGFLLFVTSLFIPYTFYYIITASILIFIGTLCFLFGKEPLPISTISKEIMLKQKPS